MFAPYVPTMKRSSYKRLSLSTADARTACIEIWQNIGFNVLYAHTIHSAKDDLFSSLSAPNIVSE